MCLRLGLSRLASIGPVRALIFSTSHADMTVSPRRIARLLAGCCLRLHLVGSSIMCWWVQAALPTGPRKATVATARHQGRHGIGNAWVVHNIQSVMNVFNFNFREGLRDHEAPY